VTKF